MLGKGNYNNEKKKNFYISGCLYIYIRNNYWLYFGKSSVYSFAAGNQCATYSSCRRNY